MEQVLNGLTFEEFIREKAALGHSRRAVGRMLGIQVSKFWDIISVLKDVPWRSPWECIEFVEAHAARRGIATDHTKYALTLARAARAANYDRYTIGSTTGTVRELYLIWGELSCVKPDGIRTRIKKGANIFDAFFVPSKYTKHLNFRKE